MYSAKNAARRPAKRCHNSLHRTFRRTIDNTEQVLLTAAALLFTLMDSEGFAMKKTLMTLALLAAGGMATPAMAADCALTVESNDQMQFNVKAIEVPKACKSYTVTLKHVGKMPKASMGHNIVVTAAADATAAAADGMKAGAANAYVKPADARVLAHSAVIGGGESTEMVIDVSKLQAGKDYSFFCSFPGHSFIMKGSLKLGA